MGGVYEPWLLGTHEHGDTLTFAGSVDGGGAGANNGLDEADSVLFTSITLFRFTLDSLSLSGSNYLAIYVYRNGAYLDGPQARTTFVRYFERTVFTPGDYRITFVPWNNQGQAAYQLSAVFSDVQPVPEPGSLALLATGGLGVFGGWYRKRRKAA